MDLELTSEVLDVLDRLSEAGAAAPWKASVEGRDHTSGDSFVRVGAGSLRGADLYITTEGGASAPADLDLIAAARNYLPVLVAEVRRLRDEREDSE